MTLQELYERMDGDFEQALRVMRVEKLVDKHIRKLPANHVFADLKQAAAANDPAALFDSAHAIKGVCANLGLKTISESASQIAEEYRPGNARTMSDEQVQTIVAEIDGMYAKAVAAIGEYTGEAA